MEIDLTFVRGMVKGVQPSEDTEAGNQVPQEGEELVKIEFLLKDILKVLEEDGKIIMSQTFSEQKTISMYSSQVDDLDYVKQLALTTLLDNLHMDPIAADTASPDVAIAIRDSFQTTRDTNPSLGTVLLEIYVECSMEKVGRGPEGPIGEHGYAKLVERLDDEVCGICHEKFSLLADIFITACHHTYHLQCILQWLNDGSHSCPICRSKVPPMFSGPVEVEL